jgi:hypothetical protein
MGKIRSMNFKRMMTGCTVELSITLGTLGVVEADYRGFTVGEWRQFAAQHHRRVESADPWTAEKEQSFFKRYEEILGKPFNAYEVQTEAMFVQVSLAILGDEAIDERDCGTNDGTCIEMWHRAHATLTRRRIRGAEVYCIKRGLSEKIEDTVAVCEFNLTDKSQPVIIAVMVGLDGQRWELGRKEPIDPTHPAPEGAPQQSGAVLPQVPPPLFDPDVPIPHTTPSPPPAPNTPRVYYTPRKAWDSYVSSTGRYIHRNLLVGSDSTYKVVATDHDAAGNSNGGSVCIFNAGGWSDLRQ